MGRVLFYLGILILIGAVAFGVYALLADLPAPMRDITIDVPLPPER